MKLLINKLNNETQALNEAKAYLSSFTYKADEMQLKKAKAKVDYLSAYVKGLEDALHLMNDAIDISSITEMNKEYGLAE